MICPYCEEYDIDEAPKRKSEFDNTCNQCEEYSLSNNIKVEE